MLAALALGVTLQSGYVIKPATDFFDAKKIDEIVTDARVQHANESTTDPLWLIRWTNQLQPMGKDKALSLVKEMATRRVNVGDKIGDDVYWLVNLLFEPPANEGIPLPGLGAIYPKVPSETSRRAPHWPIVMLGDIPLNMAMSFDLQGTPETIDAYISRVAEKGTWRSRPLKPVGDPFDALDTGRRSPLYSEVMRSASQGDFEAVIAGQMGRLVRTVVPAGSVPRGTSGSGSIAIFRNLFGAEGGRWDPDYQFYVKRNGKYIRGW